MKKINKSRLTSWRDGSPPPSLWCTHCFVCSRPLFMSVLGIVREHDGRGVLRTLSLAKRSQQETRINTLNTCHHSGSRCPVSCLLQAAQSGTDRSCCSTPRTMELIGNCQIPWTWLPSGVSSAVCHVLRGEDNSLQPKVQARL